MLFKFQIGDMVVSRAVMEQYRTELKMNIRPNGSRAYGPPDVMEVTSRMLEGCPGGEQAHYACRQREGGKPLLAANFTRFNEIELEKWDVVAWLEEWQRLMKPVFDEEDRTKQEEREFSDLKKKITLRKLEAGAKEP